MVWTSDKPSKPGWYWWRGAKASAPEVVHYIGDDLVLLNGSKEVKDPGIMFGRKGQWVGPIKPPR
jgi:hypothetical protein